MPRIVQSAARRSSKRTNASLWTIQALLALVFLFAGGMKLVVPIEMLKGPVALPGAFMRFIGVCETLGALGLILPGVFRIRTALTPLAASGLVIIMIGATTVTLIGGLVAPALVPVIVGTLASLVAYGRWRVAPLAVRPARSAATIEAGQTLAPRRAA
jgi:DoxX-like protein